MAKVFGVIDQFRYFINDLIFNIKMSLKCRFAFTQTSNLINRGRTLANRTKPWHSFQLWMWACIHVDKILHIIITA
jgi:hypothetical protein